MINHTKRFAAFAAGIIFIVLFSLSCSQNNPNIDEGYIGLSYYENAGNIEERYYVFVVPSDDDGIEDVDEMIISHEKEALRWHLSPSDWVSVNADGKTWIGTHNLAMLDGEKLPRGVFNVELVDKAAMTGTMQLTFDVREEPHFFPELFIEEGHYTILSDYPVHHFICYNEKGVFVRTVTLNKLDGEISSLNLPRETRSVALWAEEPELFVSALTERAEIR
ncbi:MAG: hypothetical protein LBV20_00780 [Treponema sp.]|jgi:hypothetical protein|nr:hypothetical protein [Treponema sp.]